MAGGNVDAGRAGERAPAGNGVDFEHDGNATIEVVQDIDPRHSRADGISRGNGDLRELGVETAGLGATADGHVRPPFRLWREATDRAEDLAAKDKCTVIVARVANRLLDVDDGCKPLERP